MKPTSDKIDCVFCWQAKHKRTITAKLGLYLKDKRNPIFAICLTEKQLIFFSFLFLCFYKNKWKNYYSDKKIEYKLPCSLTF